MTLFKILFALTIIGAVSAFLYFYLQDKNKPIAPLINRPSLEGISIIQLPKRENEIFSEALTRGKLTVENSCLKLESLDSDETHTLIFPSHFTVQIENEALAIKLNGKVVAYEGSNIEISGGEARDISHLQLENKQKCTSDLYWIVGAEMRLLK